MIIVKNRELLIPANERFIGSPLDNQTDIRTFHMDRSSQSGFDLSNLAYRLDLRYPETRKVYTFSATTSRTERSVTVLTRLYAAAYPNAGTITFTYNGSHWNDGIQNVDLEDIGVCIAFTPNTSDTITVVTTIANVDTDTVLLTKEIHDDYFVLTWEITSSQTAVPGTVFANLRGFNEDVEQRYASFPGVFYVEKNINSPDGYPGNLSELEQLEAAIADALKHAENMNAVSEDIIDDANAFALLSEAYAKGTRNNIPVSSGQAGYHNNSKYWSEISHQYANTVSYKKVYINVAEMVEDADLIDGQVVRTLGYYTVNDGGAALYRINNTTTETHYETLSNGLYAHLITDGSVNVRQTGAYGDGTHDDTLAIQTALDKYHDIYIPDGTYIINSTATAAQNVQNAGLLVKSNTNIYLSANAVLKSNANTTGYYSIVSITNVNNVTITGGKIVGDKTTPSQSPYGSEFGFGISLYEASNITIKGMEIYNCWGDAISFIGDYFSAVSNTNVLVQNCHLHDCRRQGISVVRGVNCSIDNCYIHTIVGISPQSCIDIEGDSQDVKNIRITNCTFENSGRAELLISTRATDVIVDACDMNRIKIYAGAISSIISNCNIKARLHIYTGNHIINNCKIYLFTFSLNAVIATLNGCLFYGGASDYGEPIGVSEGLATGGYYHIEFHDCVFDPPVVTPGTSTNARDLMTSTIAYTDGDPRVSFFGCVISMKKRSRFCGANNPKFLKVYMEGCKITNERDTIATAFFYDGTDITIKNCELTFASLFGSFDAVGVTGDTIKFIFANNILHGKLNQILNNGDSTGFNIPFSIVINNNVFDNADSAVYNTVNGGGKANVTVIGGNNVGCYLPT